MKTNDQVFIDMVIKGGLEFPERETERERGRNNCLLIYPLHLGSALNPRTDCWCLSETSGGREGCGANVLQILHEGEWESMNEMCCERQIPNVRAGDELYNHSHIFAGWVIYFLKKSLNVNHCRTQTPINWGE